VIRHELRSGARREPVGLADGGYEQIRYRHAVANLGIELRGDMARIEGSLRGEMANMLKTMMITQLVTALALAGFVAGLS